MANIQEVARTLGISVRAVYRRVDAFNGELDAYLTRGNNNELVFNGDALALLQRLEDVRKAEGIPIRQAVTRIVEELDGNGVRPEREGEGTPLIEQLLNDKERLIKEKDRLISNLEVERDHWRNLALDYHRQLTPAKREPSGSELWFTRVFRHIKAMIG